MSRSTATGVLYPAPGSAPWLVCEAGLRLLECCRLHVKDVDFATNKIVVRDGKGRKDGFVELPGALFRKYPNAAREWAWQWVFPATRFYVDNVTGQRRRHHLHESVLQRAVKDAVRAAGIPKPATCHTLRQSFAAHLLEDNHDIRTVQELLGHRDVSGVVQRRVRRSARIHRTSRKRRLVQDRSRSADHEGVGKSPRLSRLPWRSYGEAGARKGDGSLSTDPIAETLGALWSPLLAITTRHQGRSNGLVAGTGVFASLVPEAPRVLVEITKTSLTHDLVLASRVFALHTLPATPDDALKTSLSLVRTLGMRSGHDGDKMAGIAAGAGVTGSPILAETLTYVEARVVGTLDAEELTIFLADVVGGGRHRSGELLTLQKLRENLPKEWLAEWATSRQRQVNEARRRRGLR